VKDLTIAHLLVLYFFRQVCWFPNAVAFMLRSFSFRLCHYGGVFKNSKPHVKCDEDGLFH